MLIQMSVSANIVKIGQKQITVRGLETKDQGSSKRKVELVTSHGSLIMGDTHAVWAQHQATQEQKDLWSKIYGGLSKNPGQVVDVEVSEVKHLGGGDSEAAASTTLADLLGE